MSSQGSKSRSNSRGGRSPSPKREPRSNKLFVTNLDVKGDTRKTQDQLRQLFSKHGQISSVVVKRSHNNSYCFAFIDYKEGQDASQAMKQLNGVSLGQTSMKIQYQDSQRRRKENSGSQCFKCGKIGHFARQCRNERMDERRGRSRSRSKDRKKKKSHRHRSQSSQSRHEKKKDKKKHKSHKKSKKSKKKHYSSDSDSSN